MGRQEEGKGETRRSDCLSEWWEFAGGKDGRRSPPGASAIAFSRRNRLVWYGENAKCNEGRFRLRERGRQTKSKERDGTDGGGAARMIWGNAFSPLLPGAVLK